jgi:hypothetical protein
MTEAEWLTCPDPEPMLKFLAGKTSDRLLRLFAVACCASIWHLLTDERSRKAVIAAEQYADGGMTEEQFARVRAAAHEAFFAAKDAEYVAEAEANFCSTPEYRVVCVELCAAGAVRAAVSVKADMALHVLDAYHPAEAEDQGTRHDSQPCHEWAARARAHADRLALREARGYAADRWGDPAGYPEVLPQADLLRDIFGNPFRPSALSSAVLIWNDGAVVKIAECIYAERAFDRLPILADALLDAGCDDEELMAHLRSPGPHVRGCWALDLILGKTCPAPLPAGAALWSNRCRPPQADPSRLIARCPTVTSPRPGHRHAIGINRRELLQVGYSGLLGLGLSSLAAPATRA